MQVRKRDGSLEAFLVVKIVRLLQRAYAKTSGESADLIRQVAGAVEWYFCEHRKGAEATSEEVLAVTLRVLEETHQDKIAEKIARHHRLREQRREQVQVSRVSDGLASPPQPFGKKFVVSHLHKCFGLGPSVARIVAGGVEEQVLKSGYAVVTTAYIRELMHNELLAWGLLSMGPMRRAAASAPKGSD